MDFRVERLPQIILVDDDQALLRALHFSLELEGFRVDVHRSAATVEPQTLPKTRACLVIDYHLPGGNGLDLLARLRAADVRLPAILITSHAGEALHNAARTLQASIVEKPLLGPDLLSEIRANLFPSSPA